MIIENSNGDTLNAEDTSRFVIDYGQNSPQPFRVAILCEGSDCPYGPADSGVLRAPLFLELCGKTIDATNNYYGSDTDFWTDKQRVPTGSTFGPNALKCTPGIKDADIVDQDGHVVKNINTDFIVDYRTSGPQLGVSIDIENLGNKISRFKIENTGDGTSPGYVRVGQSGLCVRDCGDFEPASTNTIMSYENTGTGYVNSVNEFISTDYGNCGFGATLCQVANQDFGELESSCGGDCPIGHVDQGSNADYIPRGEVIAGQAFSTDEEWPVGNINNPYFHVCDSSLEGYKEMDGKTVYSPGSNFGTNYFECRDYQWIPRQQCDPGFKWAEVDGEWMCDEKEPSRINVDFLNIQNLPYSEVESGYTTGFRILSSEAEKFENVYDAELQEVNAECWMGQNDQRPSDSSKKGVVTVDVDEFRTAFGLSNIWVLTDIPSRTGVDNETYSCVWGFAGYGQHNQYIYQGVNDYFLEAMDEEAISYFDYSQIQGIYQRNQDAYSNSLSWDYYVSLDERGYTAFGGPSPFNSPNEEYPYCPPDNPLYPDADIQCD
ncbi:hypothetical protein ACK3SF_02485 [Candidatus Nanosalina sp. VS9-1]|uniref:hypothetical protein n=1 Tax=Candidatus Nanosalina sp. VS9-1 TaxID=3388566 RepID=UPI0039E07C19